MPTSVRTVCLVSGCPEFAMPDARGKCDKHRESTTDRGYDAAHQSARTQLGALLPLPCAYGCGRILRTAAEFVAAHVIDGNPDAGWVAACPMCNQRAKNGRLTVIEGYPVVKISGRPLPLPDRHALLRRESTSDARPESLGVPFA